MSPLRLLSRVPFLVLATILGSTQLQAQTFVNQTNSLGQLYSILSGTYTSSYWWNCGGSISTSNCSPSPSSPLMFQYSSGWLQVSAPYGLPPTGAYPMPLNSAIQLIGAIGLGNPCSAPNSPSVCQFGGFGTPGDGIPWALHVDAPGAQFIGTAVMDQCSTWDNSTQQWLAPQNQFLLQYNTPGSKTVTVTTYTCTLTNPPTPGSELTEMYGQAYISFNVFPIGDTGPCDECESAAGQPINLSTGDVWVAKTDYSVPGLSGGLSLTRTLSCPLPPRTGSYDIRNS